MLCLAGQLHKCSFYFLTHFLSLVSCPFLSLSPPPFTCVVRFLLGDCFMAVDEDYVNDKLEELKEEKQGEIDALEKRIGGITDRQKELKASLYERFGSSINLDA